MRLRRLIEKPARTMRSIVRWQQSALKNFRKSAPIYPGTAPDGLRVHLGAGEINLQGWINVDARSFEHIHSRTASLALTEFTDGAVSAIYMCHVLEHLSFDEVTDLLRALGKKLAVDGSIIISVPDFDALVRIYGASGNDLDSIKHALMGGQGYEYNFHKSVYNHSALKGVLEECGYLDVSRWTPETEFGCGVGDWSSADLSLNLKARKADQRARRS